MMIFFSVIMIFGYAGTIGFFLIYGTLLQTEHLLADREESVQGLDEAGRNLMSSWITIWGICFSLLTLTCLALFVF